MNVGLKEAIAYFRDGSVSTVNKAVGLLAILYVLSPIDLVPDTLPLLGWLDDVGIIALLAAYYSKQITSHATKALPARVIDVRPVSPSP